MNNQDYNYLNAMLTQFAVGHPSSNSEHSASGAGNSVGGREGGFSHYTIIINYTFVRYTTDSTSSIDDGAAAELISSTYSHSPTYESRQLSWSRSR